MRNTNRSYLIGSYITEIVMNKSLLKKSSVIKNICKQVLGLGKDHRLCSGKIICAKVVVISEQPLCIT